MNNFCTLFDSHYLSRGLVMYNSLAATCEDFHLFIYPFDDLCRDILLSMALPHVTVVPLDRFEHERVLEVKPSRSRAEYCWTCTPHVIGHALECFGLSEVTYIDADLFFYQSPSVLLEEFELSGASVLITPHRYTPCYDISSQKGIYCVQFMTFRSDERGMQALTWWQERCLEWCYNRNERGLFGDQKYLDDWPERFPGVHVLAHVGGGVAPWNVQQYSVHIDGKSFMVNEVPIVFYHFHGYLFYRDGRHNLGYYRLTKDVIEQLYRPYIHAVQTIQSQLAQDRLTDQGYAVWDASMRGAASRFLRKLKGEYNVLRDI